MANLVKEKEPLSTEEKEKLPVLTSQDKPVTIRLSGTAITEAGKLTRHRYFEFLHMDLDDYSDMEYTEEEAKRIRGSLGKMMTGSTSMVPLICSPKCPFKDRCVFAQMNKLPFGRACLVETNLLREWTTAYFNEYGVDPNNFTEVGMINELAEIEVYQWRLNQNLARAENAELVTDVTVGATPQGRPIVQKQISQFLEAKERLSARKARLIKLMVGDRQEKYKKEAALKQKEEADPSTAMANMRERLERLQRMVEKKMVVDTTVAPQEQLSSRQNDKQEELTPNDIINSH